MRERITSFFVRPFYIGLFFLSLMPLFAALYFIIGGKGFNGNPCDFWTYLYFSVVTITTLGFGDIYPITTLTKLLVALEVVMGALCAGLFLNACSYTISERSAKAEKAKQELLSKQQHFKTSQALLLNQDSIVSYNLNLYLMRIWTVCTPMNLRNNYSLNEMLGLGGHDRFSFSFRDMKDLHKPSLLLKDAYTQSSVVGYFKELHLFTSTIKDMINFAPVREWPDLQAACLQFLQVSNSLNFSEMIIKNETQLMGDKKLHEYVSEMISSTENEPEFQNTANLIDPYVSLYLLLQHSLEFCVTYLQLIESIVSETSPTA